MKEFQLIQKYFKPLTKNCQAAAGLTDDVAKFSLKKNEELVISKDLFVEDVHFLLKDGGFKIASKLLATNLSDLASSGAKPLYYMLGFSKNKNLDQKFYQEFAKGLSKVQDDFKIYLIGGDTVSSEKLVFSITIFGTVKNDKNLARNKAKNGDLIFVSGSLGDSYLGLKLTAKKLSLQKKYQYLINRHFFPTPRIKLGQKLAEKNLSNCAIDISDGFLADLNHICQASKLNAEIKIENIPTSNSAKNILVADKSFNILDLLSGGDDYELIFSSNPKNYKKIINLSKQLKLDITCVGEFKKSTNKKFGIDLLDKKNNKIKFEKLGYQH